MPGSAFQILGNNIRLPGDDSGNADVLSAGPNMISPITGHIVSVTFLVLTAAGHLIVGVYADSGGAPGALIGFSASTVAVQGWQEIALSTPAPVTAGDAFWLATLIEDNGLHNAHGIDLGGGQGTELELFVGGVSYGGGMPDPFPGGATAAGGARTILCRVNPT